MIRGKQANLIAALSLTAIVPGCASVYPVTVRVIDSTTGMPVPDADVSVERRSFTMFVPSRVPRDFPSVQAGTTDEHGEMTARLVTGQNFAVVASHPGYIENDRLLPSWNRKRDGQLIEVMIPAEQP